MAHAAQVRKAAKRLRELISTKHEKIDDIKRLLHTECFVTNAKSTKLPDSVAIKHRSVVELKLNDGRLESLCPNSVPPDATESAMDVQNEWVSLSTPPRPATQPNTTSTFPASSNITPFEIVYYRLRPNYQSAFFYACESGRLPVVEYFLNFSLPRESQPPESTGGQPSPALETTEETMELEVVMVEPPSPLPYSGRRPVSVGTTDPDLNVFTDQTTASTRCEHDSLVVCSTDEQRAAFLDQACIFKSTDEIRRHRVRPLWVASVRNHLPIVKLLVACARHLHERGIHLDLSDWGPPRAILPLVYSRDGAGLPVAHARPASAAPTITTSTTTANTYMPESALSRDVLRHRVGSTGGGDRCGGGGEDGGGGPRRRRYRHSGLVLGDADPYLSRLNRQSDTLSTPVRSACFDNNTEIVDYLLSVGASISRPNVYGSTCLVNSIRCAKLTELLLRRGANVNALDNYQNTPIHYAIREERLDSLKVLVELGNADCTLQDYYGNDAFESSALSGNVEIFEYLIQKFALPAERPGTPRPSDDDPSLLPLPATQADSQTRVKIVPIKFTASMTTSPPPPAQLLFSIPVVKCAAPFPLPPNCCAVRCGAAVAAAAAPATCASAAAMQSAALECVAERNRVSKCKLLRLYELAATSAIDEKRQPERGLELLRKACALREQLRGGHPVQATECVPHAILSGTLYPYTREFIDTTLAQNRTLAQLQAVRLRMELLVEGHPDTLYWLLVSCAKHFATAQEHRKRIEVWRVMFELSMARVRELEASASADPNLLVMRAHQLALVDDTIISRVKLIVQIFWKMLDLFATGHESSELRLADVNFVLRLAVDRLRYCYRLLRREISFDLRPHASPDASQCGAHCDDFTTESPSPSKRQAFWREEFVELRRERLPPKHLFACLSLTAPECARYSRTAFELELKNRRHLCNVLLRSTLHLLRIGLQIVDEVALTCLNGLALQVPAYAALAFPATHQPRHTFLYSLFADRNFMNAALRSDVSAINEMLEFSFITHFLSECSASNALIFQSLLSFVNNVCKLPLPERLASAATDAAKSSQKQNLPGHLWSGRVMFADLQEFYSHLRTLSVEMRASDSRGVSLLHLAGDPRSSLAGDERDDHTAVLDNYVLSEMLAWRWSLNLNEASVGAVPRPLGGGGAGAAHAEAKFAFNRQLPSAIAVFEANATPSSDRRFALNRAIKYLLADRLLRFPSRNLLALLLAAGSDPNARDSRGRRPLHRLARGLRALNQFSGGGNQVVLRLNPMRLLPSSERSEYYRGLIEALLDAGAHIDYVDARRHDPLGSLLALDASVAPLAHRSLQCLAARAVRDLFPADIYRAYLPSRLVLFVDNH